MKDKIWGKISYFIGLLPVGALFGLLVFVANIEIKDFDLWLHLAVGKFMTINKFVPSVDILSCSIAGKPWINHEWLFQVIVYNLYSTFGPDGILKMQIGVVLLTMLLLLFLGDNKNKQLSTCFTLLLVYLVYQQRFTIRPDIFSLLFFSIYIFILALHLDKRWSGIFLCVIQILWSNMHGFFFFGPLFVLIGLVSEWCKRHIPLPYEWNEIGRLTDEEYGRLKIIFIMVSLSCLVNPAFIKGALYPMSVFMGMSGENKIFFDYIQELQRPISWDTIFQRGQFAYYKLLIVLSFISFVFNRRRIDISALFFWLIFLFFSLGAIRNAVFFAFAAYLVCITNVLSFSYYDIIPVRFANKKFLHMTSIMAKILLVLWIFNYCGGVSGRAYYDFDKQKSKSEFGGVSLTSYPNKAADFLVENNIKGNFFNDFNSGAYLLGRCYPNIKVFIDGRTEVYGGEFFQRYHEVWEKGNEETFQEIVDEHNLTGAFLNASRFRIPVKILKYLYNNKEWVMVYFNYDAVIFLRDIPENREHINRLSIDLESFEIEENDIYQLGAKNVLGYQNYYRAFTLESLDFDAAAMAECLEAVKTTPTYDKAYQLIGKLYAKKKKFQKAFEYYRIASILSPGDKAIRYNLALSYFDMGDYANAAKEYELILSNWGRDPEALFFLAKAYSKDYRYDQSSQALNEAYQMGQGNFKGIKEVADIAFEQKEYHMAKEIYELSLKVDNNSVYVNKQLGNIYQLLGETDKAEEKFKKALLLMPQKEKDEKEE